MISMISLGDFISDFHQNSFLWMLIDWKQVFPTIKTKLDNETKDLFQ